MKPKIEPIFTADDFDNKPYERLRPDVCADIANAIFLTHMEARIGPKVYGWIDSQTWSGRHTDNTHTAYLFDVQEIVKCVEHKVAMSRIGDGDWQICTDIDGRIKCGLCGVALKVRWEAK